MSAFEGQSIDVEALYSRYGPMVLRRCRRLLKDEQAAFDAMQEVFVKVVANRKRLTADYPSSLLYRIATNICLNRIREDRKRDYNHYLDMLQYRPYSGDGESEASLRLLLDYILAREKNSTRTIAEMYFINGMTITEIASLLDLSPSGVHKRLKKLRRRIKARGKSDV
jgi:RNA polymerase sigma-70 factor (ECF subfamily)